MAPDEIERHHRAFLDILGNHGRRRPHDPIPVLNADGHQAIRALIEEIHDQGYILGQLHADGLFPEGCEVDVAAQEERLGIDQLKAQARYRLGRTDVPPTEQRWKTSQ